MKNDGKQCRDQTAMVAATAISRGESYMKKKVVVAARFLMVLMFLILIYGMLGAFRDEDHGKLLIHAGAMLMAAPYLFSSDILFSNAKNVFNGKEVDATAYIISITGFILLCVGLFI